MTMELVIGLLVINYLVKCGGCGGESHKSLRKGIRGESLGVHLHTLYTQT
jgi:hypothetical protein